MTATGHANKTVFSLLSSCSKGSALSLLAAGAHSPVRARAARGDRFGRELRWTVQQLGELAARRESPNLEELVQMLPPAWSPRDVQHQVPGAEHTQSTVAAGTSPAPTRLCGEVQGDPGTP